MGAVNFNGRPSCFARSKSLIGLSLSQFKLHKSGLHKQHTDAVQVLGAIHGVLRSTPQLSSVVWVFVCVKMVKGLVRLG